MSEGSRIAIGLPNYMNQEKNDVFDFEMPQVPELVLENIQEFKDFFHTAEGMFKDNKLNLKNNWKEFSEIFDKKNMARKECLLLPLRTVLKALQ